MTPQRFRVLRAAQQVASIVPEAEDAALGELIMAVLDLPFSDYPARFLDRPGARANGSLLDAIRGWNGLVERAGAVDR